MRGETMSAETKQALDEALAAHLADECPGSILTGYALQTQYTDMQLIGEQMTGYLRMTSEQQNFTTTLGLTHYMMRMLDHDMTTKGDDD